MTFKDLQTFSSLEVPAPDSMIRGSGEQYLARPVDGHARDGSSVLRKRVQWLGLLERPYYCGEVGGTGHQYVLVLRVFVVLVLVVSVIVVRHWNEDERINASPMSAELADTLAAVEVPAARGAVVRTAEDEVAGADHPVDGVFVTFHYLDTSARRHVPLADCLVGAAAQYIRLLDQYAVDAAVIVIVIVTTVTVVVSDIVTLIIVIIVIVISRVVISNTHVIVIVIVISATVISDIVTLIIVIVIVIIIVIVITVTVLSDIVTLIIVIVIVSDVGRSVRS